MPQVAIVLLARLLSWLQLSRVVSPSSPECLRFVLVLGERQAGKASLFTRLVDAPPEYAGQLGGGTAAGLLDGSTGMGAQVRAVAQQSCWLQEQTELLYVLNMPSRLFPVAAGYLLKV